MQLEHCTDPAVDYGTRARVLVLASASYVCITETNPPASQDVRLPGGKGVIAALEQVIAENDAEILALCRRNDRTRRALEVLRREGR